MNGSLPTGVDDSGQLQNVTGGTPASVAASFVFGIGTDLSCFCHQQIQFSLRKVIELLKLHFSAEQVASEPFACLFLRRDVAGHAVS